MRMLEASMGTRSGPGHGTKGGETWRPRPPRATPAALRPGALAALLAGVLAAGCGEEARPPADGVSGDAPSDHADAPNALPAPLDTGPARGPGVPAGAIRAVVLHLEGFTDEGISSAPLPVAGPGSFAVGDVVWTDAGALAGLLAAWDSLAAAGAIDPRVGEEAGAARPVAADPAAEAGRRGVGEAGGRLVLGGEATDIPARAHAGVVYAPVDALARRFGALFYRHPPPDPGVRQVSGTVWPRPLLCHYGQGADPEAAVFRQAREEGLFAACEPDPSGRVREPGGY